MKENPKITKDQIRQLIRIEYDTDNILFVPGERAAYAKNGFIKIFCAWKYITWRCVAYKTFFHKGLNEHVIVITKSTSILTL